MTRLRSPLKQRGAHTIRWAKWHERSRIEVMKRCQFHCEGCDNNMRPLEWAHLVGRGNTISEPWCSTSALTVGLCSSKYEMGCHERLDRNLDKELQDRLRWQGLERLCEDYGIAYLVGAEIAAIHVEPLDAIRAAIRILEMAGSEWDGKQIVKVAQVVRL